MTASADGEDAPPPLVDGAGLESPLASEGGAESRAGERERDLSRSLMVLGYRDSRDWQGGCRDCFGFGCLRGLVQECEQSRVVAVRSRTAL